MASLTTIALTARKVIRYIIYFIILFIVGRITLSLGLIFYKQFFPPPPPAASVAFGPLPALPFPERRNLPTFNFKIETPSGGLPVFPDQQKIYYMPKSATSLFSYEATKGKASALGFSSEPEALSPTLYRFIHTQAASTLEINIVNDTFSVSYNLASDPLPLTQRPPIPEEAINVSKGFISNARFNNPDLSGPPKHEFMRADSESISTALSLSDANLIKVSLFRRDYDKLPAKTPDPNTGNVWFLLSGEQGTARQIVAAEYHYFPIDETQFATYPTKNTSQAVQDLQSGNAYIANLGDNQDGNVTVRRIYMAYYDAGEYAQYYQPIFVFEGDRNFVAYTPAVMAQYYGK